MKEHYTFDDKGTRTDFGSDFSLLDLWRVVSERWLSVIAGVVLGALIAITYITLTAPIYESHASIQISKIHELGSLENLESLAMQLNDQYGAKIPSGGERELPYLQKVRVLNQHSIIKLESVGRSPGEARDFLARVAAKVVQQQEQLYQEAIGPFTRRVAAIDTQIPVLKAQLDKLGVLAARLKESQPAQASFLELERSRIYAQLNEMERDRVLLQQKSGQPYISPSKIVTPAVLVEHAAAPQMTVTLVVGLIGGLGLGLVVAFVRAASASLKASQATLRAVSEKTPFRAVTPREREAAGNQE